MSEAIQFWFAKFVVDALIFGGIVVACVFAIATANVIGRIAGVRKSR